MVDSHRRLQTHHALISALPQITLALSRFYSSYLKSLTILTPTIAFPGTMETLIPPSLLLIFAVNRNLAIENLALRQQLAILRKQVKRPRIRTLERMVSRIIRRLRSGGPPYQTSRAFLKNHMHNTCAIDFLTVPTATSRMLYVSINLHHESRKVVHFNVTANPPHRVRPRQDFPHQELRFWSSAYSRS